MTIEDDIVAWGLERPGWQQEVLVALANGEAFDARRISALTDGIVSDPNPAPNREAKKIALKSSAPQQVKLTDITGVKGVNALMEGQTLPFAKDGLTIVYGDNGSGKSGYARLIKGFVKARHDAVILPDVFSESPQEPEAVLKYTIAGVEHSLTYPASPSRDSLKMSFYDEHCGDQYLHKQSTISYRPSALTLLDGLIDVCDRIRDEINSRLKSNESSMPRLNIAPETTAGAFVVSINARTSSAQVDAATKLPPGTSELLGTALQEEARLLASDPGKEQRRLTNLAIQFRQLHSTLVDLLARFSSETTADVIADRNRATELRMAANLAANTSFESEPLAGVGATTWRIMWEAARDYSLKYPYHDHEFPVTDDAARCVLCQQPLQEDARDRLRRFDVFMKDTTERDAATAEAIHANTVRELAELMVPTPTVSSAVAALISEDAQLGNAAESLVSKLEEQRRALLAHLRSDDSPAPEPLAQPRLDQIRELAESLQARADATNVAQFQAEIAKVSKQRLELSSKVQLSESAGLIRSEIARLDKAAKLRIARSATDTNAITQRASNLTRKYATTLILDQFTRETDRLRLERVTLEDLGGQKGQLTQKPGLLGAKHRAASAPAVLSEGEQTALGLAGFFTEAMFDTSKSCLIFDDPVTSLDHVRRDKVAERLAQLAKDRQVVVFTHDVAFTGDLAAAAESEGVGITERSVERQGSKPGAVRSTFPWKARDFKSRVDHLQTELARIKKDRPELGQTEYEERVASWAGYLSETWERCVTTEIMNQVFDRGTSQVRVMKFRLLAKISEADDKDFQEGYGHTSKWARRHDKSPGTNYVAPELADLEAEIQRLVGWQKRIKAYL